MINIAHLSPNLNAYSETFIQTHRKGFDGNVFFYYGGNLPTQLDGYGMFPTTAGDKLMYILKKISSPNASGDHFKERALIRSFLKNKINVVYAEYGTTGVAILNVCKKLNIPLIVNFHGFDISVKSILEEYKYAYQNLFQYAYAIVAVSRKMVDDLVLMGCPSNKIIDTPCPPNSIFFDVTPSYSEDSFIAVGRFTEKKAPYYTILAFHEVLKKKPNATLYMAGNGDLHSICENIIKHLGIQDNVKLIGICNEDELVKHFKKVKAFVQHSIIASDGDCEGTPVAILEASAAAIPIISTKHAGINDVVIDNITGYLVEEHDTHAMAQKMLSLLEQPDICKELGVKGRQFVKENFTADIHLKKLNDVISSSMMHIENIK